MPTGFASQKLDDLKLSVLSLLSDLWDGDQVRFALASDAPYCEFDIVLDVLANGGEVELTFASSSHRTTIQDICTFRQNLSFRPLLSQEG